MIPYRIHVFRLRYVTTVMYIWISFAYCFPNIEIRTHMRDHVLSLTSLMAMKLNETKTFNKSINCLLFSSERF